VYNVKRILLLLIGLCFSSLAFAHPLAPSLLKIDITTEKTARILWKESTVNTSGVTLLPVFPAGCYKESEPTLSTVDSAVLYQWNIYCNNTLVGEGINIQGLRGVKATVLVDFGDVDGNRTSVLLAGHRTSFVVPAAITSTQLMSEYGYSGIVHLISGWDHVLFVLGLFVLLYKNTKSLLLAVTAFTVGHSVTLVVVSLAVVSINEVLVESFIALSILILALEILNPTVRWFGFSIKSHPYLLTGFFGLVHGCGFASILAEMLSNNASKLLPLVSFNVGIELGQCIILSILVAFALSNKLMNKSRKTIINGFSDSAQSNNSSAGFLLQNGLEWKQYCIGYGLGVMSVYWLILRLTPVG